MSGLSPQKGPVLSEELFSVLRNIIKREFGLNLNGDKRLTLQMKLLHRLDILGFDTFEEYIHYILTEPYKEELFHCISHIVNNETYFMREVERLEVFKKLLIEIKKNKVKNKDYSLRILSAGCSTGEEVYTINILLIESGLFTWGWDTRIVGMDVSQTALKKARAAVYTENSFRNFERKEEFKKKYFYYEKGRYILKEFYKRNTYFIHGNILSEDAFKKVGTMDIIFCRNVMIYMTDEAIKQLTENFFNYLNNDGYLIIGSTETLIQKTDLFIPEYREGIILYRKNPHMIKS